MLSAVRRLAAMAVPLALMLPPTGPGPAYGARDAAPDTAAPIGRYAAALAGSAADAPAGGADAPAGGAVASAGSTPGGVAGGASAGTPRGNRRAYAFLSREGDNDAPIARWNPCGRAIGYRVNLTRAPKGALNDVKGAVRRIADATGLRFGYRGTTKVFPKAKPGFRGTYPAGTDLIIAWAVPGRHSLLLPKPPAGSRGPAGVGGAAWSGAYTRSGGTAAQIIRGQVVLDATLRLTAGFGTGPRYGWVGTRGQLLMHEIGHAVGLAHPRIDDPYEIMYPTLTHKTAVWGAGDRAGLTLLGRRAGCLYDRNPAGAAPNGAAPNGSSPAGALTQS